MSDETRQKLRELNSGENHPMWGTHPSEETLIKLREAHKGFLGKTHTEESKQKLRKTRLGKKPSKETKEKMKIAQRKRRSKEREAVYV